MEMEQKSKGILQFDNAEERKEKREKKRENSDNFEMDISIVFVLVSLHEKETTINSMVGCRIQ